MAGKRGKRTRGISNLPTNNLVPDIFQEMLAEVLPQQTSTPARPSKLQKTGHKITNISGFQNDDDKNELTSEDALEQNKTASSNILDPQLSQSSSSKQQQTAYEDFSENSEESDYDWETVGFAADAVSNEPGKDLELTLSRQLIPQQKVAASRRRTATKAERIFRLEIHKVHILCLLSYLDRRNKWCNDELVQTSLKPLLSEKLLKFLRPKSNLSQFGRTESLKRGLDELSVLWKTRFSITERGMRRALWSDDVKKLQDFRLPEDVDSINDLLNFRKAAAILKGSRDIGAQLYCALLRSADIETRLVCSIQPLPFKVGGPIRTCEAPKKPRDANIDEKQDSVHPAEQKCQLSDGVETAKSKFSPPVARRLGHPNAADYHLPKISTPQKPPLKIKRKIINESPYPTFWVEVFDKAYQKWLPVDPLVTQTIAKPRRFEPPASDRENNMTYVIAFDEGGCARDVTRKYVKAYNGKTRKCRVESIPGGEKWWANTMRFFFRKWYSDADQVEEMELANAEAMEPMPKNVADFKDHSYFALERHLRRNEVLVGARASGKICTGRDSSATGGKKMEDIYRRRDVKVARSADAWYRLGRGIKMGEQPVKVIQPKSLSRDGKFSAVDRGSTNLYIEEQTELYVAPPIVNGRVPKNSFGNIEIFVPTMIPKGNQASRAAKVLDIDYADALTGFEFRGRRGTAILKGVVVATEYAEAMKAIIAGLEDEEALVEKLFRSLAARKMWKRFIISLRIKKRIDGYRIENENTKALEPHKNHGVTMNSDDSFGDGNEGGFFPE